jgi:hypothetical protein
MRSCGGPRGLGRALPIVTKGTEKIYELDVEMLHNLQGKYGRRDKIMAFLSPLFF